MVQLNNKRKKETLLSPSPSSFFHNIAQHLSLSVSFLCTSANLLNFIHLSLSLSLSLSFFLSLAQYKTLPPVTKTLKYLV